MAILKSIGTGILSLIVGNLVALILSLIVGVAVDPIAEKFLSEPNLKKFRHIWSYAWVGFTVGMINSSLIFFWKMNGWIVTIIFIIYLVFFMGKYGDSFVFNVLCAGDEIQFKKLSARKRSLLLFHI